MHTSGVYGREDVARSLDSFFERLNDDLDTLIERIQQASRLATDASATGHYLAEDFERERMRLMEQKEDTPFWRALTERGTFKANQLSRNLDITHRTYVECFTDSESPVVNLQCSQCQRCCSDDDEFVRTISTYTFIGVA